MVADLAEDVFEHGLGQATGIGVVARAMIGIGEQRAFRQHVHGLVAEFECRLLKTENRQPRAMS